MNIVTPESQRRRAPDFSSPATPAVLRVPKRRSLGSGSGPSIEGRCNYDCHKPLNVGDLYWIKFYDGAESDQALQEMLFVNGENIRAFRSDENFSGDEMADFLGISQKAYQKIESGETRRTSLVRIVLLSLLFNQQPDTIALTKEGAQKAAEVIARIKIDEEALGEIRVALESSLPIKPRCSSSALIKINGELLRTMRIKCGLSRAEIGRRLDYSVSTIGYLERDEASGISDERLNILVALLGVEPEELLKAPGDAGRK
jgi:transcriptional regulator with XRE-family HTH domain